MSTETETEITVRLGGERLYVFPYSVDEKVQFRRRRVYYLRFSEMTPYLNEDVVTWEHREGMQLGFWRRLWYCVFKRILVAFGRHVWNRGSFETELMLAVPFLADSYPELRFGLRRQWMVVDSGRNVDQYYLTPSQQWIHEQLMERLTPGDYPEHWEQDVNAFRHWMREQKNMGREIRYLVSIDT